ITRPYLLRYNRGKAFNKNSNISKAIQNLIITHRDSRTFLKHYFLRRITVDI
ncbi:uncharacterized protein BDZ99DRAFT_388424, partial [Mytilinidion resinicola]